MALLIPIPKENRASLERALDRVAPFDWATSRKIHVFVKETEENIAELISERCQDYGIDRILVPKRVHCDENRLKDAGYEIIPGPSLDNLIHGSGLLRHLKELGLDWRGQVLDKLRQYPLGKVGETEIDKWLLQFEQLGNHRPVGVHLLQLLDILPPVELGDALSPEAVFYGQNLVVGFNNDKPGKSGAAISTLMRKKCPSALLLPITEAIENGGPPKVLRLVEDGLFSGTEVRGILDSLLGTRPDGRAPKVPQLADPGQLRRVPAQFHFAVVCDFGDARLRRYLSKNGLQNIQISVSPAARKLQLLTTPSKLGTEAVDEETFIEDLRSRITPFAFQPDKGWKDPASLTRAQTFCEVVGEQLWKNYIQKKSFDLTRWPPDRIRRCGLGMEGLGLTFAFPHSVPKATLPVFWSRGPVTLGGVSIDWQPLLPLADT